MSRKYKHSINQILNEFPSLHWNEERKLLGGNLEVNHTYFDEHIIDSFLIEIIIPYEYDITLPRVYSKDKKISLSFDHMYRDGMLCLATDADQLCFFADGHNLNDWINDYVIPYFFAVEYFKKYKFYPFGEREHGYDGIISFYAEKFMVHSRQDVIKMLDCIVNKSYRGHLFCPCGSGKRIRNCHKDIIFNWQQDKYHNILKSDFVSLTSRKENN